MEIDIQEDQTDTETCDSDHGGRQGPIITIDGPAGSGKSTVAGMLAARLGFVLLETGGLYRVMALHLSRNGVSPDSGPIPSHVLASLELVVVPEVGSMRIFLGDDDVTTAIRGEEIGRDASRFSVRPEVRKALLGLQRSVAAEGNMVAEGRDMGTIVFPEAQVKFFLTADLEERADRRFRELAGRGEHVDLSAVFSDMRARDERDRSRAEAPLVPAPDSVGIDTVGMSPPEVVDLMLAHIQEALPGLIQPDQD